jgi:hypothetical protein
VPTLAQLKGDFSLLAASKWPIDLTTGQPFPNGIIPASRLSSNSVRLLGNYPAPNFNGSGGNYVFNTVALLDTNEYIYNVDYNISSEHQLSVHYVRDYYTSQQNQTQLIEYNRNIPGTNSSAKWTYVPNPTTVNVAQFTFTGNVILEKTGTFRTRYSSRILRDLARASPRLRSSTPLRTFRASPSPDTIT